MQCPLCEGEMRRYGRNRNGSQRYRCDACQRTFTDEQTRPIDHRCVEKGKIIMALRMLLEGNSIRAVQRLTGIHRDTIISAMIDAGQRCRTFMLSVIRGLEVQDVQVDEIWGFVGMKEKTRLRLNRPEEFGDVWCFTGIERHTKLLLAYHVGKRTPEDTARFATALAYATRGHFQLTTDGYPPYRHIIPMVLGGRRIDYATLVKVYGEIDEEGSRRYSPAEVIGTTETPIMGEPDEAAICTSHVERSNRTLRMQIRRLTRLTDAHSKKWENHEAAMALFFAYHNFCRVHMTLRKTPATEAGLTGETWSLERLLEQAGRI